MPLIILGLIVIISIVSYWYFGNKNSDEPFNPRDIGDRFSNAAQGRARDVKDEVTRKIRKRAGIYDADYRVEDDGYGTVSESDDSGDNTIPFPSDVEREKRRRDIH